MALEIERKWLVPEAPEEELAGREQDPIRQGYLVVAEDGSEVRVRRNRRRSVLTYKSGGTRSRTEIEIEISAEQFEALWPATAGRRVSKHRVNLPDGIDLDIYDGDLDGLVVAEVEFDSEAQADAFTAPAWFGADVTEDRAYKNHQLAVNGRPAG